MARYHLGDSGTVKCPARILCDEIHYRNLAEALNAFEARALDLYDQTPFLNDFESYFAQLPKFDMVNATSATLKELCSKPSAFVCSHCRKPVTLRQEAYMLTASPTFCLECHRVVDPFTSTMIHPTMWLEATRNPSTLKERHWIHATLLSDWYEQVTKKDQDFDTYVHIGTPQAAFERAKCVLDTNKKDVKTVHFYEIEFNKDAVVYEQIVEDTTYSDILASLPGKYQAVGYWNRWENVGSLSIECNPKCFKVVKEYTMPVSKVKNTYLDNSAYTIPEEYWSKPMHK